MLEGGRGWSEQWARGGEKVKKRQWGRENLIQGKEKTEMEVMEGGMTSEL